MIEKHQNCQIVLIIIYDYCMFEKYQPKKCIYYYLSFLCDLKIEDIT